MFAEPIQKLIDLFKKFPTVGPRTAARFVFYLIKMPQDNFEELINSLKELKENTKLCPSCFNPYEGTKENLCPICQNNARNKELLCVIEKEADLEAIEKTKNYKGLYFVLGGTINLKRTREGIRIEELKEKIKNSGFKEIIIATNLTPEGEATALFLERELANSGFPGKPDFKMTRLGRGLPVGGELEYADPDTLESSLKFRS